MEGFGVLRAALLAGAAAVEVRAISNEIGEDDRARWDVAGALAALHAVLPQLLVAVAGAPADGDQR
jgi:futalosine hydrolase